MERYTKSFTNLTFSKFKSKHKKRLLKSDVLKCKKKQYFTIQERTSSRISHKKIPVKIRTLELAKKFNLLLPF